MVDDVSVAATYGTDAAALVDAHGFVGGMDVVLTNQANALMLMGDWDRAMAVADRGTELDTSVNSAGLDTVKAVICTARGERVPDPEWSDADLSAGASWHRAYGSVQKALQVRSQGDAEPVAPAVRSFLEYRDIAGLSDDHAVLWHSLFDLARSDGDHDSIDSLLALIGDDDLDRSIPVALRAHRHRALGLMALDVGDVGTAIAELRRGIALYEEWKARPLEARTRGELGAVLLRSGDEDEVAEGRRYVEAAREVLSELRATTWLAELDAALDRVGSVRG
jgi:tetratricopeptide (TPR) repeat protein